MSVGLAVAAPNREPPARAVELVPEFPNNEGAACVTVGPAPVVKVVEPPLGKEPEAGTVAGFDTLPKMDGVVPAVPNGLGVVVVVEGVVLDPAPNSEPPGRLVLAPPESVLKGPLPREGRVDEVVALPEALLVFPKTLPPAAGAVEAFPKTLIPGLAKWHEVSYEQAQEYDNRSVPAPEALSSGLGFEVEFRGFGLEFRGLDKFCTRGLGGLLRNPLIVAQDRFGFDASVRLCLVTFPMQLPKEETG